MNQLSGTKIFFAVLLAILVAFMISRGIKAAEDKPETPSYQVVPCESNPTAIGC